MNSYQKVRIEIKNCISTREAAELFLRIKIGIDITKDGFIRVRSDDRTPSCKINKDGSFHDFGSGEHYRDIVSLLYDGYGAFNSLFETMKYVCQELNIDMGVYHE
jgi:hypothetical protein